MQIYPEYRPKPVSGDKFNMRLIIARKRKVRKKNCNFLPRIVSKYGKRFFLQRSERRNTAYISDCISEKMVYHGYMFSLVSYLQLYSAKNSFGVYTGIVEPRKSFLLRVIIQSTVSSSAH